MSEDFDKSDFDKRAPLTKSQEDMGQELWAQVLQEGVKGLENEKKKLLKLESILREDEPIKKQLNDFVDTFLGGELGYLYQNPEHLIELQASRKYLGAKNATWACQRIRIGMISIMERVGADMDYPRRDLRNILASEEEW